MSAIWLCTRAQLRGRVRVTILLALLVGLAGAVVLTSFAAARRTKQALPRFLRESSGIDALAIITDPRGSAFISKYDLADEVRQVRTFPEVRLADRGAATLIQTPDASRIAGVSFIRLGSVTHAIDMDQRLVPLAFTVGSGSLSVQAPANANLAPPGHYMLFIVDANGVPSIAKIMRIS